MNDQIKKILLMFLFIGLIVVAIKFLYPGVNRLIIKIRTHSYVYNYTPTKGLESNDISNLPEARSVPILIYHGVVTNNSILGENTKRETFISQMEMLKREGYQTISVEEYDLWRENKFTLPPKPIIITFDDGRKDSYFTVDEILKKLGFKATLFIATQATENNPFFISWNTLKKMQLTGRWEIEAHGRDSHLKIITNNKGDVGNFLSSRIYDKEKGLESISDYEKRIDNEYSNGKLDLLNNLGINAKYFAIPLNSYGVNSEDLSSNYDGAYDYNDKLTRKYYKLAFIQAESTEDEVLESFYNYKNTDPYKVKRLQVKNMSADNLLIALNNFAEKPLSLTFPDPENKNFISENVHLLYGKMEKSDNEITISSNKNSSATRIILGSPSWRNYLVNTEVIKYIGKSLSIIVYYIDEDNFLSLDWSEKSLKLIQRKNGKETELDSYYPFISDGKVDISFAVKDLYININCGGVILKGKADKDIYRGSLGFSVWDPIEAKSIINTIKVSELN